jgi:hypothetical protein
VSSLAEEYLDEYPPERRRLLPEVLRTRRPGRVGAYCDRCEEDLDAPDNRLGYELVVGFEVGHAGHERRGPTPLEPGA